MSIEKGSGPGIDIIGRMIFAVVGLPSSVPSVTLQTDISSYLQRTTDHGQITDPPRA